MARGPLSDLLPEQTRNGNSQKQGRSQPTHRAMDSPGDWNLLSLRQARRDDDFNQTDEDGT